MSYRNEVHPYRFRLSLPFIPSCLPTAVRLSGTDTILSQRILKSTTGAVIPMLIPPDRAREHYAMASGCRQRPRRHREKLIESQRGWSGRETFVTMMQTADLG